MYKKERQRWDISIRDIILMMAIFTMLYMSSSYNVAVMNGTITLGVIALCSLVVLFVGKKNGINLKLILITVVLCSNVLLTSLFVGEPIKYIIIMIVAILISMIFVIGLDFRKYCEVYTNVILTITIYSLVAYVVSILVPSIIRLFPSAYYRPAKETYNLGLSFVNLNDNIIRNMGIFWEPGAFQTYLVFAFLIELFILKSTRRLAIILYLIALITTWSTTGIINALVLLLILIIYKNNKSQFKLVKILVTAVILSISIISIYTALPPHIQYATVGKISVYLEGGTGQTVTSASVRHTSITYPLKSYFESPITGIGYSALTDSTLDAGHTMTTNTPVNWFAAYGTLFGLIFCVAVFKFSVILNNNSWIIIFLIFITIMLSISSQQYLRNISIIVFLLYGLSETTGKFRKTTNNLKEN